MNEQPSATSESRARDGRFVKGVSGNPGGQPKARREFKRMIADATGNGAELVAIALEIARDRALDVRLRLEALEWLADRVFGKPRYQELREQLERELPIVNVEAAGG